MKAKQLIFLVISAAIVGCDGGPVAQIAPLPSPSKTAPATHPSVSWPTIQVDAQHALRDEGQSGTPYLIKGSDRVVIDARKFTFRDPDKLGRRPNVLRILYNEAEYVADLPEKGDLVCTVDGATLQTLRGQPFNGFIPGQRAAIGIGYQASGGPANRADFREFWVGWVIFD